MINTTLCYILRGEDCLLLHRNKKKQDINEGKWIGVGGKMEEGECPVEAVLREAKEETGLSLTELSYRAVLTFVSDQCEGEYIHLFTSTEFTGTLQECNEGTLAWKPFSDLFTLPHWAGDEIFLKLLQEGSPFFSLKLVYQGDNLVDALLNGVKIS